MCFFLHLPHFLDDVLLRQLVVFFSFELVNTCNGMNHYPTHIISQYYHTSFNHLNVCQRYVIAKDVI